MKLTLSPHPDTPPRAVRVVEAEAWPTKSGDLVTRHRAIGDITKLCRPPSARCGRADNLWQHTCFEAFINAAPDSSYYEFNYSPSSQWAAYRFDVYRSGMRVADEITPQVEITYGAEFYEVRAYIAAEQLSALHRPWRVALTAVIEETDGVKSYWALKHPPGKADFHHADGFVLELP